MSAEQPYDFYLADGDDSPTMERTLTDESGAAVDVSTAVVDIHIAEPDGTLVASQNVTFPNGGSDGVVAYDWGGVTLAAGSYQFEFEVTYTGGRTETFPNDDYLSLRVKDGFA